MTQQPYYNVQKLINALKGECEKARPSYPECLRLMKNLGNLLSATDDIDIEEVQYQSLWSIASAMLNRQNNVPLILRMITIHVYATLTVKSYSKHHNTAGSVAYTLIIKEIKNEVSTGTPSTSFLISIFDAIYLCAKSSCCDDKETISCLLSLQPIVNSLTQCAKDSIAAALDIDLDPFVKLYKYGQHATKMNALLQSLGCSKNYTDTQRIIPIPPRTVSSLEKRLALQKVLKTMTPYELAQLVIQGFHKFEIIEGYEEPKTTTELIKQLNEDQPTEDVKTSDSAVFIIEQALANLQVRSQYIPLPMQSQFIAMLITTIDSNEPFFDECKGPATRFTIQRSSDAQKYLIPFLSSWCTYEFVRNSEVRYDNLVWAILNEVFTQETSTDDSLTEFILSLPKLPEQIFINLRSQSTEFTRHTDLILPAINEYIKMAPSLQPIFLDCLLQLSILQDQSVAQSSINMIKTFYKQEEFVPTINSFAIEYLKTAVTIDDLMLASSYMELFFTLLEFDCSLFITLLDVYPGSPKNTKSLIRDKLKSKIPQMQFKVDVVKQAIEHSRGVKDMLILIHVYLDGIAKQFSFLAPDLVLFLKNELEQQNDSRFLIPIIPSLTKDEFKKYLPYMLNLSSAGLKRAVTALLTVVPRNISGTLFLIELNRIPETSTQFTKAGEALKYSFEIKDALDYQTSISAVDAIIRKRESLDLIMDTLFAIINKFQNEKCYRYVLNHTIPQLIALNLFQKEKPWNILMRIIAMTKPHSFKVVIQMLQPERITDLIREYPDLKQLLFNQTKVMKSVRPQVLQVLQ
ncbi:hypothetical protein GPJ56_007338 [Histomonas meleagridis]|uniref:uncharacterized protein n=1 Tax=Histomonas meleagridis TaxID=135588 RepID=UPI00355A0FA6|nr:hypothetical protein GPJ56_007338 [Histomonas meleagridis]KAH0804184.1 hypothetical protein GO595_003014 [Histomonas meleagridis]